MRSRSTANGINNIPIYHDGFILGSFTFIDTILFGIPGKSTLLSKA